MSSVAASSSSTENPVSAFFHASYTVLGNTDGFVKVLDVACRIFALIEGLARSVPAAIPLLNTTFGTVLDATSIFYLFKRVKSWACRDDQNRFLWERKTRTDAALNVTINAGLSTYAITSVASFGATMLGVGARVLGPLSHIGKAALIITCGTDIVDNVRTLRAIPGEKETITKRKIERYSAVHTIEGLVTANAAESVDLRADFKIAQDNGDIAGQATIKEQLEKLERVAVLIGRPEGARKGDAAAAGGGGSFSLASAARAGARAATGAVVRTAATAALGPVAAAAAGAAAGAAVYSLLPGGGAEEKAVAARALDPDFVKDYCAGRVQEGQDEVHNLTMKQARTWVAIAFDVACLACIILGIILPFVVSGALLVSILITGLAASALEFSGFVLEEIYKDRVIKSPLDQLSELAYPIHLPGAEPAAAAAA